MGKKADAIILGADRAQALAHYPHARRAGNLLFLCGTSSRRADNSHAGVSFEPDGTPTLDITAQTEAVILHMRGILRAAGLDLIHLVDVTTYLVDMKHFAAYNEVYNRFFQKETGPARTTLGVKELPHPNLLIEMKGIAAYPDAPSRRRPLREGDA